MKYFSVILIKWMYIIFLTAVSILAYLYALFYFWSCFEWSPLGCETCGLEFLGWIFIIYPLLIFSFCLKLLFVLYLKCPKIFWISPIVMAMLLLIFTNQKGCLLGIMAMFFILLEIMVNIYSAIHSKLILKQ